ncbi:MarR family winged helix-turn-helix transcriptional regulator [Amnibacterium kyonggiense]
MDEAGIAELHAAVRALQAQLRRSTPPVAGVSRTAARVLGVVARAPGGSEQPRGIADRLAMTSSNVAAALRELERAEYVERRPDPQDGRRVSVALTERGAAVVAEHQSLRLDGLRAAVESALTPEEQRRLADAVPLLGRIAAAGRA